MCKIAISLLVIVIASQAASLPTTEAPSQSSESEATPSLPTSTTNKSETDPQDAKGSPAVVINAQSFDLAVFQALTNRTKRAAAKEASTTTTTTPKEGLFPYGFNWNRF
nr:uncharacterized protein LOC109397264 [Aedes albopictus]